MLNRYFLTLSAFCVGLILTVSVGAMAKSSALLASVEKQYRGASTIKMDAAKKITLKALDQEKKSTGTIQIKKGGRLRWETDAPDHTLVLAADGKIWMVSYPSEPEDKVTVLKASNPKKSQPQAVVAFLMGQGRIGDQFKVISETASSEPSVAEPAEKLIKLELKPRHDDDPVQWLALFINKKTNRIEQIAFRDAAENTTELRFSNIKFNEVIENKVFKFTPPKGADVTVLN